MWPKRVFESSESASQPPRSVRKSEGAGKPRPLPVTADSYQWNRDSFSSHSVFALDRGVAAH